jgi:hypothetical protein
MMRKLNRLHLDRADLARRDRSPAVPHVGVLIVAFVPWFTLSLSSVPWVRQMIPQTQVAAGGELVRRCDDDRRLGGCQPRKCQRLRVPRAVHCHLWRWRKVA